MINPQALRVAAMAGNQYILALSKIRDELPPFSEQREEINAQILTVRDYVRKL